MIQQKVRKKERPFLMLIFSTVNQKLRDWNNIFISILCLWIWRSLLTRTFKLFNAIWKSHATSTLFWTLYSYIPWDSKPNFVLNLFLIFLSQSKFFSSQNFSNKNKRGNLKCFYYNQTRKQNPKKSGKLKKH